MSKPRLFLHIGHHKTGSTAIQSALFEHRPQLAERGISYPLQGMIRKCHHNVAWDVLGIPRHSRFVGRLREVTNHVRRTDYHSYILSSEVFDLLAPPQIYRLARALTDCDVVVAVYVRRQDKAIEASWAQSVRGATTVEPFDVWFEQLFSAGPLDHVRRGLLRRLDIAGRVQEWAEVFGVDRVRVREIGRASCRERVCHRV